MTLSRFLQKQLKSLGDAFREEHAWGTGRLFWPVWFACGIGLYFALHFEPELWFTVIALIVSGIAVWALRTHWVYHVMLGVSCCVFGFTIAAYRTHALEPVVHIQSVIKDAHIEGYITQVDWYPETVRVQLQVHKLQVAGADVPLKFIVLNAYDFLPQQKKLHAGQWLVANVSLRPSPAPVFPDHPDPRFRDYFEEVAARGTIQLVTHHAPASPEQLAGFKRDGWKITIQNWRVRLREAIMRAMPNENGAIAAALIMGDRSGISPETTQSLTAGGLLHFLSISGAHMAMVAGVVFLIFRRGLALIPVLAVQLNLKKLAAFITFWVASFYLLISGNDFATERSYVMIVVTLLAVMVDRPAFTLNSLCLAAGIILLVNPEALYYPGLQMSFAATAALLGVVSFWSQHHAHTPVVEHSVMRSVALKFFHFASLSIAAGLATEPFAAFHFHQLMPYSITGNVVAAPLIELIIMPFLVLGLVMMPFGLEHWPFALVDWGMTQLKALCAFIASLPHAILTISAFPQAILLCAIVSIILLALLRTCLRLFGLIPAVIGGFLLYAHRPPDIMAVQNLVSIGIQQSDGTIGMLQSGQSDFAVKAWTRGFGAGRIVTDVPIEGMTCSGVTCSLTRDGTITTLITQKNVTSEDCVAVKIVITNGTIAPHCQSPVQIDRRITRMGPFSLWLKPNGGYELDDMRGSQNRLWIQQKL